MNVLLSHIDWGPIVYGLVIFVGLLIMWFKLIGGRFLSLFIDIGVFWLVFTLHGGTMTGGFAATVAALLAGTVFPMLVRR